MVEVGGSISVAQMRATASIPVVGMFWLSWNIWIQSGLQFGDGDVRVLKK